MNNNEPSSGKEYSDIGYDAYIPDNQDADNIYSTEHDEQGYPTMQGPGLGTSLGIQEINEKLKDIQDRNEKWKDEVKTVWFKRVNDQLDGLKVELLKELNKKVKSYQKSNKKKMSELIKSQGDIKDEIKSDMNQLLTTSETKIATQITNQLKDLKASARWTAMFIIAIIGLLIGLSTAILRIWAISSQ